MDTTYYKLIKDTIVKAHQENIPEEWDNKYDWSAIRTDNRKALGAFYRKKNIYNEDVCSCIENPENFPFSNAYKKSIVLNLSISNAADIYKTDFISLIIENKVITIITPEGEDFFNERSLSTYSGKKYSSYGGFIFYIITAKLIAQNNTNISIARKRIHEIELSIVNSPEKLTSKDLMACERDIGQLSDIIEDQNLGFQILDSLSSSGISKEDNQHISKLIKGFDPLAKAISRLEKKSESLRIQYMLIQQEKSTRKINVLTIIQAIFVPMTFIAGVYGMNFTNMPELEWPLGYLLVWILFVGMACGLLVYFYKKGWFN